jgi:transposase
MRRTHLRGHANILKRLLIHAGGFNLGLVMRQCLGVGKPRRLQGRLAVAWTVCLALWARIEALWAVDDPRSAGRSPISSWRHHCELLPASS